MMDTLKDNNEITMQNTDNVRVIEKITRSTFDMKFKTVDAARIKKLVTMMRRSPEYKRYIRFLKKTLHIDNCAFYSGFGGDMGMIIEMHHHPFRMYEYTETICNKHMRDHNYITTKEVMTEVLQLHYKNMIGLIPLSPTAHKLNHSDNLYIHPELVLFWDGVQKFIEEYKEYFSSDLKAKVDTMYAVMKKTKPMTFPDILKEKKELLDEKEFTSLMDYNVPKFLAQQAIKRLSAI